jgi:hypothetical protein
VTLYGDDEAYAQANPVAGREEGVLGHAQPQAGKIGIAVARLRDKSEGFRRDALRHELAHVVLGDLSRQRLPIGFQEGIAQYLERDHEQRQRFARTVQQGRDTGQLLPFSALNQQRPFLSAAGLSYPQSYSMVVFLAERYGFGKVVQLVLATRDARTLDEATLRAFDRTLADLESEWQAFLPGFLDGGWQRNDLDLWDLTRPRHLLAAGKFAEARDLYDRAEGLFRGVGHAEKLGTARTERQRAETGVQALDLTHRGMNALTAHQYEPASDLLKQAEERWRTLGDIRRAELVSVALTQAQDGRTALENLEEARGLLAGWRFQQADDLAYAAGHVLAELGDETGTEAARTVMRDAHQLRTNVGLGAAGGGAASVVLLSLVWALTRRRERKPLTPRPGVAVMEKDWSL